MCPVAGKTFACVHDFALQGCRPQIMQSRTALHKPEPQHTTTVHGCMPCPDECSRRLKRACMHIGVHAHRGVDTGALTQGAQANRQVPTGKRRHRHTRKQKLRMCARTRCRPEKLSKHLHSSGDMAMDGSNQCKDSPERPSPSLRVRAKTGVRAGQDSLLSVRALAQGRRQASGQGTS